MTSAPPALGGRPVQAAFDELGTPLREVTFVVVDLETTGGAPADCGITEVGAVKVRGGEVLAEFQTLVHPGGAIPAFISLLTGITDAMVAGAPRLEAVLPAFLEFVGPVTGATALVAHNAPYDTGFLKAAAGRCGLPWPGWPVVDTARLARAALTRDDTPNCKLGTLARTFRSAVVPDHRALTDARATVDVLHGLLERVGGLGVQSLEELLSFSSRVSSAQRRKRHLAEAMPDVPGVYVFADGRGRPLYVGKATSLRSRVRSYFTASEMRSRMAEMVGVAESVTPVVCATLLEAEVRELRLIAELQPRYNRRSRFPDRAPWVKLTVEPFPRLSLVRQVRDDGATYLGPFSSSRQAELATAALHDAVPLRQCTAAIAVAGTRGRVAACVLHEIGRCGAPCEGREDPLAYAEHAAAAVAAMREDAREVVDAARRRIERLTSAQRYEDAALARDRLAAFVRVAARMQRITALASCAELVAARRRDDGVGGWEVAVVRHGRLVGAGVAARGTDPRDVVDALRATAEPVRPAPPPAPAALVEETEAVLRWLETPGTRLVSLDGTWCSPRHGAGVHRRWLEQAASGAVAVEGPAADRRRLRPVSRPVPAGVRGAPASRIAPPAVTRLDA